MIPHTILIVALVGAWDSRISAVQPLQRNSENSTESTVEGLTLEARRDFDSGKYSEARANLHAALKLAPADPALWIYLGLSDAQLNQIDTAIADFEKALSLSPGNAQAFFNLGLLYRGKGNIRKSLEMYQDGLALEPDDPAANQNYGLLLMEEGKYREALEPLAKLKARNSADSSVRVALIECYLKGGMRAEGEREIQSFLQTSGVSVEEEVKVRRSGAVAPRSGASGARSITCPCCPRSYLLPGTEEGRG